MALRFEGGFYWDNEDGPLTDADVAAIRDRRIDAWEDELAQLAISLLGIDRGILEAAEFKRRTVNRFSEAFRKKVAEVVTNSYVSAAGGLEAMTQTGWNELTELLVKQDRFAVNFTEQIKNGELSERQIVARARQYAGAGTEAFERGKAALRHFEPPEVPGALCRGRSRCRCFWEILTKRSTIEARWRSKNDANTCEHCAANAVRWNPLIQPIPMEDLTRPDPEIERPGMGDLHVNDFYQDFTSGPSSAAKYLEPDGKGGVQFTAARQALHDQIIRAYTDGIPASQDKTIFMLGGGGGAGKTTMIRSGAIDVPDTDARQAVLVNADELKAELPEYEAMTAAREISGAMFAHEESSYLSKRLIKAALENGQDILLDGVGLNYRRTLNDAEPDGYEVHGYYAFLPDPEVAVERAIARAERTGRYVPPDVVRGAHRKVAQVFPDAAEALDSMVLYNTSTREPKLVAHTDETGKLVIDEPEEYEHFLSLGD